MKYFKATLCIVAFVLAVYAQYRYSQSLRDEAYLNDAEIAKHTADSLAKSVESFPDHSRIPDDNLKTK